MPYEITFEEKPLDEDVRVLEQGLFDHGRPLFGEPQIGKAAFFIRDEKREIVGGIYGNYGAFGWLYVDTLWVAENLRGRGFGAHLMALIEDHCVKAGCTDAFLNTFSFQAPEFYKKLGYTVFGQLENFPAGHSRLFLRKKLVASEMSWSGSKPQE